MDLDISTRFMSMMRFFGSLLLLASSTFAADRYVRAGAGGSNNGTDWANAYSSMPATLTRGDTYWIADGSYGSYDFDDAESSTTVTTVRKATVASHGTETGWSDVYGDGQADFTAAGTVLVFSTGYWLLDGQVGSGQSGYGFLVNVTGLADATRGIRLDAAPSVTIQYVEIVSDDPGGVADASKQDGIYSTNAAALNVTIAHNYIHEWKRCGILASNLSGWIVEHNFIHHTYSTTSSHGQAIQLGPGAVSNFEFRYNTFKDTHGTGVIVYLDNTFDDIRIHGNLFWHTGETAPIGLNSTSQAIGSTDGDTATNIKIYNNTFVGMKGRDPQPSGGIDHNGTSTGNVCYNNLWYDSITTFNACTNDYNAYFAAVNGAPSETNGQVSASNPFINAVSDFRLTGATNAGTSLSSPYNLDLLGITRAVDGVWDRGAYEYDSGALAPRSRLGGSARIGGNSRR